MVDNKTHEDIKVPPSNDSKGSSKKRKHDVTENDVIAFTDSTTHKLSDILPIALTLFKGNNAKSMKIQCDTTNGISVEINDGKSFTKSSKGMNNNNNPCSTTLSQREKRRN